MTCEKITYYTRKSAFEACNAISKKGKQSLNVYECYLCGHFHLATHGKSRSKKDIKRLRAAVKYPIDINSINYKVPEVKRKKRKKIA